MSEPSANASVDRPGNPYMGPTPFRIGDRLYGRDNERREVVNLLLAHRVLLMYSPSGAGKTSLIQAGLIPDIRARGLRVRPVIRLNKHLSGAIPTAQNRYLMSALGGLQVELPEDDRCFPEPGAEFDLGRFLGSTEQDEGDLESEVLIFDQFEEIVSLDATDVEAKREFFEQVGEVLSDPRRRAVFAMREEFVGALDDYRSAIPRSLDVRYRLDLLDQSQAVDAIVEPAANIGVRFERSAAELLADQLRTVNVQRPDGVVEARRGRVVEPVQLQIVCERLWKLPRSDGNAVTTADVEQLEGDAASLVDDSLAGYYADRVADVAREVGVPERELRNWFTRHLISDNGVRLSVLSSPGSTAGLKDRAVAALDDARLIRREDAAGRPFVELSHDRLVRPILDDNASWAETNLSGWQRVVPLWERQKPDSLLLRGRDLADADAGMVSIGSLTPVEQAFLKASRILDRREKRFRRLLVGVFLLAAAAGIASVFAFTAYRSAREQELRATSRQLAALAANEGTRTEIGLILARQAYEFDPTIEAKGAMLTLLERHPALTSFVHGHDDRVVSVAFSPDGRWLASGSDDRTVRLIDQSTSVTITLTGHEASVAALSFSSDNQRLASADDGGEIRLWEVATGALVARWSVDAERVRTMAFHPTDPQLLASGASDGAIRVWRVGGDGQQEIVGTMVATGVREELREVHSVAFDPTGTLLASGGEDSQVRLWNWSSGQQIGPARTDHSNLVRVVSFSTDPHARLLASAGNDRTVILWTWNSETGLRRATRADGSEIPPLEGHTERIYDVDFAPGTSLLASASRDRTVRLWDAAVGTVWKHGDDSEAGVLDAHAGAVRALAFRPAGARDRLTLATASNDRTVAMWEPLRRHRLGTRLDAGLSAIWAVDRHPTAPEFIAVQDDMELQKWNVLSGQPQGGPMLGHTGPVRTVRLSGDGQFVASAGDDCTIRLWRWGSGELVTTLSGPTRSVTDLAFSPNGSHVVAASQDGSVRTWELASQSMEILTSISPDESGLQPCTDSAVAEFDGTNSRRLPVGLRFTPDGDWLIATANDGSFRIWDWPVSDMVTRVAADVIAIPSGLPASDVSYSGNADEITLWELPDGWTPLDDPGIELLRLPAPLQSTVAAGPEASLVAGSRDGTFRVWDTQSGRPFGASLNTGEALVDSVGFPTERRMVTAGDSGGLIIWNLDPEEWRSLLCPAAGRSLTRAEWRAFVPDEGFRASCSQR